MSQQINAITEVPCPPACTKEDKGFFVETAERYGCMNCNLFFRHTLGGYKLSPQDMYDMIHGDRMGPVKNDKGEEVIIDGKPVIARWTDFHEFTNKAGKKYKAALAFEPGSNWKIIRRFPERAPVESTGRLCPKCQDESREGQLLIRTTKNGEKFLGCSAYPKCSYTEPYAPFMVKINETKAEEPKTEESNFE